MLSALPYLIDGMSDDAMAYYDIKKVIVPALSLFVCYFDLYTCIIRGKIGNKYILGKRFIPLRIDLKRVWKCRTGGSCATAIRMLIAD